MRPSLAAIYEEHFDFVWRTAKRMRVPPRSLDDVVQDVFLVVHRRLEAFHGASSMRSWIYGIVRHTVADHRRRARRKDAPLVQAVTDDRGEERFASTMPPPDEAAAASESLSQLERMLASIAPEKAEVVMLTHLEGMSVPEIAECVGANVNTVYSRLRAGRQELAALAHASERGGQS